MTIFRNLVIEKMDWYLDELIYEMECLTGKRVVKNNSNSFFLTLTICL